MLLRERVDLIVQAGLRGEAAGEMAWDVSDWDELTATWSGLEPAFADIDGWTIESVETRRGRDSERRRHSAGTATIVLVWSSPAGKWSYRPSSPVLLGQEMRVLCRPRSRAGEPLSAPIPIYRGSVRSIRDGWQPDRRGQMLFRLTAQLIDRFGDLAAVNLPEQALTGLGDLSHERIARIMELAGVDTYYLRAGAGVVQHASSNFARNLLDEAQVTTESEVGDLYVDREGFVTFRERLTVGTYPREASAQLTWSNLPDEIASIAPSSFGTGLDLDDVVNQLSLARAGGTAYTVSNADSILRYGLRTTQRFDLTCRYAADVEWAADYWLAQLATRTQRIDELGADVHADLDDARLLELIDIEIGDRQAIRWTDGDAELEGDLRVQGIAHRITGDSWAVRVSLWARAGEGLAPAAGRWSEARWSEDAWGA